MKRSASAVWNGNLKDGKGTLTSASGVLDATQYSFASRFESGRGTNPEELIAAAHSGCFAMALSAALGEAGFSPQRIDATSEVTLENAGGAGWKISASHLTVTASVPGIDASKFAEIAGKAKANCPVSKVLNATITLDAKLAQ